MIATVAPPPSSPARSLLNIGTTLSATQPSATPSWIASFTTLTVCNSPEKACESRTPAIKLLTPTQTPEPITQVGQSRCSPSRETAAHDRLKSPLTIAEIRTQTKIARFGGLKPPIPAISNAAATGKMTPAQSLRALFTDDFVPSNKKVGISADLVCWISLNNARSVLRDDRAAVTAEAIVDAQGDQVHVLIDPAVEKINNGRVGRRERIVGMPHEQMIVFNAGGPIRCEAILPTHTHGAAPAGRALREQFIAESVFEDAKAGVCDRRAALHVEQ